MRSKWSSCWPPESIATSASIPEASGVPPSASASRGTVSISVFGFALKEFTRKDLSTCPKRWSIHDSSMIHDPSNPSIQSITKSKSKKKRGKESQTGSIYTYLQCGSCWIPAAQWTSRTRGARQLSTWRPEEATRKWSGCSCLKRPAPSRWMSASAPRSTGPLSGHPPTSPESSSGLITSSSSLLFFITFINLSQGSFKESFRGSLKEWWMETSMVMLGNLCWQGSWIGLRIPELNLWCCAGRDRCGSAGSRRIHSAPSGLRQRMQRYGPPPPPPRCRS